MVHPPRLCLYLPKVLGGRRRYTLPSGAPLRHFKGNKWRAGGGAPAGALERGPELAGPGPHSSTESY